MARNVPEPPPRLRQSVYWRRRAAVLASGAALIIFLVWTVTGVLGGAGHANGAARPGAAATPRPARGGSSPASHRAVPPGRTPAARQTRAAVAGPRPPSRPPAGLPPACPPSDLVLSLATSQGSYGQAARPRFDVFVVSVGARDCSVNIAPAALSVVVRRGGTGLVWDSADCARGSGAHFVQLSRGVPRVLHFQWGRRPSSPGCRLGGTPAPLGTYTATAVAPAARLASQGMVFVLAGAGVGMP